MPFAVFRRHQKKMLAVFAILAMFGFVLSDSLYRFTNQNSARNGNRVIVDLYGKPVYRSDLDRMAELRSVANRFFSLVRGDPSPFGTYTTREMVDALILKHEADRLGIPETSDFGRAWLKQQTGGQMNKPIFEMLMRQLGLDVSGEQVLASLASQVRLVEARRLMGGPVVTPLDVYRTYRDQNERSSFRLVSFPAANFLDKVGEPTDAEVASLYDSSKDVLPDPARPTPGFKVPRQVKLEILSIDGAAVAKGIQEGLTEPELRAYYETRKGEFARTGDLPVDLFKDDPTARLTPQLYLPFEEVRDSLAGALARERAQEGISEKFTRIRDQVIDAFADKYNNAVEDNAEARKSGSTTVVPVPRPTSLADVARAEGLTHEITPLLTYDQAKDYGTISRATVGSNPMQPSTIKFADAVFAPKSPLYDGMEFSEVSGRRYLARKLEDVEAHVAPLAEVRPAVVAAWKLDKARGLADAAATAVAATIKAAGGRIKEELVAGRPVIAIDSVTKLRPGMPMPGPGLQFGQPTPVDLPQVPNAGDDLRETLFGLKPGDVAVAADTPRTTFYVLSLDRRVPSTFAGLYGPTGMPTAYLTDAYRSAILAEDKQRMEALRASAGLKPDWAPPDEKDREDDRRSG